MKISLLVFLASLLAFGCESTTEKQNKDDQRTSNHQIDSLETNSDAEILNNIIVHESGGLKAGRVYLAFEDGRLVPKDNRVSLGTPVYLVLVINEGWQVTKGLVSLDASVTITTNQGEYVSNDSSVFNTIAFVKESYASRINLKSLIAKTRPGEYYIVSYRLWDKKGGGEIKGSYRLYMKAESP